MDIVGEAAAAEDGTGMRVETMEVEEESSSVYTAALFFKNIVP